MMKSKGQAAGAASVVGIVALILVIYIILIPTEDRRELLGESLPVEDDEPISQSKDNVFTFDGPGNVAEDEEGREIDLPSFYLKTSKNSKVLVEDNAFYVTNGYFEKDKVKVIDFSIDNLDNTEDLTMSFVAQKRDGVLSIKVNDYDVFESEMNSLNVEPIKIYKGKLAESNRIEVSVNGPGLAFWERNEYIIDNFKIFGEVTETTQQSSILTFDLEPAEVNYLNRLKLKFYPSCEYSEVNRLYISLNGIELYSQVPDCKVLNIFDIPVSSVVTGINKLEFRTDKDSYLVDRVSVESEIDDNNDLTYYFNLDEDLFLIIEEAQEVCGEIDGVCPSGCDEDLDKDCCFKEYDNGFWCDVPTVFDSDRCVGKVDQFNFDRCPSGYEDQRGDVDEDFEGICGDDDDGDCPFGCSADHDKDCCLTESSGNYWCDDLTSVGVAGICVSVVTEDSCAYCPKGYEGEDRDPKCTGYNTRNTLEEEVKLKSEYEAKVELRFVNDNKRKRGRIRINQFETTFSTNDYLVEKDISDYVLDGNNYVQIIPENEFNLVNIKVSVE